MSEWSNKLDQSEDSNSLKINIVAKAARSLFLDSTGRVLPLIQNSDEVSLNNNSQKNMSHGSERERISLNIRD